MYTEHEVKEFLYPNITYCETLKNWWKTVSFKGVDFVDGYHDRQRKIGEAVNMNYDHKSGVAIHFRDIVAAMIVSDFTVLLLRLHSRSLTVSYISPVSTQFNTKYPNLYINLRLIKWRNA